MLNLGRVKGELPEVQREGMSAAKKRKQRKDRKKGVHRKMLLRLV